MKFYDRESELKILADNELKSRENAEFTVIMGRRRIGKTSLILKSLEGKEYAYLFVSRDSEAMLCSKFQQELESALGINIYGKVARFSQLLEMVMQESKRRHFTVVLDEVQNLYRTNRAVFSEIQDVWDRNHKESKINLVCCGSIHSLMQRIFEDRQEPLYGRATSKLTLLPFATGVLKQIMADYNPQYKPDDLLTLYMLTGGVAKYVELLMDNGCTTRRRMLDYVCRQDSYFLTEGRNMVNNEFSGDFDTYFSILQLIAQGFTRISEIDGAMERPTGTYLQNLERNYQLIRRVQPLMARPNSKVTKYEISDHFLRFWFRFVYPFQSLIERNQLGQLRQYIEEGYATFSGRSLELYFQDKAWESGLYTEIGNWWDRKGTNEIDLLAINQFTHKALAAEVKRNRKKISLDVLREKCGQLPSSPFSRYQFDYQALSLEDM